MMIKLRNLALLAVPFVASVVLVAADGARAAEPGPAGPHKPEGDWKFSVGAAVLYKPASTGSKDYQAVAVPNVKVEYKDRFFASPMEGIGYNVVKNESWRAGPIMKFDMGRKEKDDNPFRIAGDKTTALKGLGDVDSSLSLGGFVEYSFKPFSYSLEVRQAVNGHKGLVGKTGLNFKGRTELFGKPVMYSLGPRATFADSDYNDAYFGITQAQSARSGLARYSADAGLVSYGIGAFAGMPITNSVSLGIFAGYDRLGSEAADSPLVKERGSENQFMGGLRLTYEFRL